MSEKPLDEMTTSELIAEYDDACRVLRNDRFPWTSTEAALVRKNAIVAELSRQRDQPPAPAAELLRAACEKYIALIEGSASHLGATEIGRLLSEVQDEMRAAVEASAKAQPAPEPEPVNAQLLAACEAAKAYLNEETMPDDDLWNALHTAISAAKSQRTEPEPITQEALLNVGYVRYAIRNGKVNQWYYRGFRNGVAIDAMFADDRLDYVAVQVGTSYRSLPHIRTMPQLRQLVALLGGEGNDAQGQ